MSLVREAFSRRPESAAVVLTWTQPFFSEPDETVEVKAWTAPSHFDAALMAGLHQHSRIFPRDEMHS